MQMIYSAEVILGPESPRHTLLYITVALQMQPDRGLAKILGCICQQICKDEYLPIIEIWKSQKGWYNIQEMLLAYNQKYIE